MFKEEIDILAGRGWLNDQIIGFYFEYLQTELFKDLDKVRFFKIFFTYE